MVKCFLASCRDDCPFGKVTTVSGGLEKMEKECFDGLGMNNGRVNQGFHGFDFSPKSSKAAFSAKMMDQLKASYRVLVFYLFL